MCKAEFEIKQTRRDFIVIRGDKHSHCHSKRECIQLIDDISSGKMPIKRYFKHAARRLLEDCEYNSLREQRKPKYINCVHRN